MASHSRLDQRHLACPPARIRLSDARFVVSLIYERVVGDLRGDAALHVRDAAGGNPSIANPNCVAYSDQD